MRRYLELVPGLLGWLLVTSGAVAASIWSSNEMFYEGWWGEIPHPFVYLVPGFVVTILAAVPVRWPRPGGWFLGSVGVFLVLAQRNLSNNQLGLEIAIPFVVAALMFIMEGWRLEKIEHGILEPVSFLQCSGKHFVCRNPRLSITLGLPLLTFVTVAAFRILDLPLLVK